jgi:hypothetical protein
MLVHGAQQEQHPFRDFIALIASVRLLTEHFITYIDQNSFVRIFPIRGQT